MAQQAFPFGGLMPLQLKDGRAALSLDNIAVAGPATDIRIAPDPEGQRPDGRLQCREHGRDRNREYSRPDLD